MERKREKHKGERDEESERERERQIARQQQQTWYTMPEVREVAERSGPAADPVAGSTAWITVERNISQMELIHKLSSFCHFSLNIKEV